ncbi:MAG: asparagine synthase (glutamine-hydrolyzing), partial [Deltaproteobacteria bacterium]|nr:asparagine synthase (glutamine-hydrolyzing) [Deltaproteobacteria bacterium]
QNEKLFLARDLTGIKPLYYYTANRVFLFSSELRAILDSHLDSRRLSPEGLASYLECGSVQTPWTIIEGVRSLEPGHYMVVEPEVTGLSIKKLSYVGEAFSGTPVPGVSDRRQAVELLRELLAESVCLHLTSDVPLGVFLSGGIDSSALVALMSEVSAARPKSFSVVFAEREFSESSYSRLVAKKFNTEHQEIRLSEGELPSLLPEALAAMDQPTMDGINTYVISKCVKEAGVTVALSGLGGDELFGGYPSFRRVKCFKAISRLPRMLRKVVSAAGRAAINGSVSERKFWEMVGGDGSPETTYRVSRQLFSLDEARHLMRSRSAPFAGASCDHSLNGDPINAVSLYELQGYMANTLLRDTDCMSMARALEVRVPFLDTKVISFVLGLPGAWKIDGRRPKPLLLDALRDLLPEEIWRRPKMGFTFPFERWMRGRLKPEIEGVLASGASTIAALGIDPGETARVWRAFAKKPQSVGWTRPWALYVLLRWCELHRVIL